MAKFWDNVKPIAILLIICLVCGALLAICNDLFYISDEELFNRSMQKIYPSFDNAGEAKLDKEYSANATYGSVNTVYQSKNGAYVIEATGIGGYKSGTVTVYVAIEPNATIAGVSVKDYTAQTLMANISDANLESWYKGLAVATIELGNRAIAGTTLSSAAINNAVNMACYYAMNALGLGENPEKDAMNAVKTLLANDSLSLSSPIKLDRKVDASTTVSAQFSDGSDVLSYYFESADGTTKAFVYGQDEDRKIIVTDANGVITNKSENVNTTDTIYDKVKNNFIYSSKMTIASKEATLFAVVTAQSGSEGQHTYTVSGISNGYTPSTYVLNVTIESGEVKSIEIVTNGYVPGQPTQADADALSVSLIGATLATVDGMASSSGVAGATQSGNMIAIAVKASLYLDSTRE